MPKFISDEDMAKISPKPRVLSDEAMAELESSSKAPMGLLDTAFAGAEDFAEKWTAPGRAMISAASEAAAPLIKKVDSYTGAPVRRAVYEAQDAYKNGLAPIGRGFLEQFGSDKPAPTGADIARRAGVPDTSVSDLAPGMFSETGKGMKLKKGGVADPSASGTVGLLNEIGTDPLSYVGAAAEKPIAEAAPKIGAKVEAAAKGTAKGLGEKAIKLASTTSGVPQKEIETLLNHTDEVLDLAKKYNNDMAAATDAKRAKWSQDIRTAREGFNKQITEKLQSVAPESLVDIKPITDEMERIKSQLHSKYEKQAISEVERIVNEIKTADTELAGHSVADLYAMKSHLQDLASGAYKKEGQIFHVGKDVQRAAKAGAARANKILREVAPEIKEADDKLFQLRKIEERLNKNVLGEGKSNAALMSAGANQNQFQRGLLAKLDKITGSSTLSDAEKLAAARTFGDPSVLPVDTTGKSWTRLATGLGGGMALGGPKGAMVGAALTSPAAIKAAAQGRNAIRKGLLK